MKRIRSFLSVLLSLFLLFAINMSFLAGCGEASDTEASEAEKTTGESARAEESSDGIADTKKANDKSDSETVATVVSYKTQLEIAEHLPSEQAQAYATALLDMMRPAGSDDYIWYNNAYTNFDDWEVQLADFNADGNYELVADLKNAFLIVWEYRSGVSDRAEKIYVDHAGSAHHSSSDRLVPQENGEIYIERDRTGRSSLDRIRSPHHNESLGRADRRRGHGLLQVRRRSLLRRSYAERKDLRRTERERQSRFRTHAMEDYLNEKANCLYDLDFVRGAFLVGLR
jgi:hypothetical protein